MPLSGSTLSTPRRACQDPRATPTWRLCSAASCKRLSERRSTIVSRTLLPFSAPRDWTSTFRPCRRTVSFYLLLSWQHETGPAVALAGAAGRLPAHFRTRVWDDAHCGWPPSRTLCSACPPQFSLPIKSPNSRSTSSRFLRFRRGVPTSRK